MTEVHGKLESLQAARGVAALLVLLFHASATVEKLTGHSPFGGALAFGYCGVDFFFPLSGFIICLTHTRDMGEPSALATYAWKRVSRVYPLYWLILVPTLAFGSGDHTTSATVMDFVLLRGVTWTLTYELLFYAVFAIAIIHAEIGKLVIAFWGILSLIVVVAFDSTGSALGDFIFGRYTLEFLLGFGAALLVRGHRVSHWRIFLWPGIALLAALALVDNQIPDKESYRICYAAASFLVIIGLVLWESATPSKLRRPATFLGDASYSIFLCHIPLLSVVYRLAHGRAWPPTTLLLLIVLGGIAVGIAAHVLFESPLLNVSRSIGRRWGAEGGRRNLQLRDIAKSAAQPD